MYRELNNEITPVVVKQKTNFICNWFGHSYEKKLDKWKKQTNVFFLELDSPSTNPSLKFNFGFCNTVCVRCGELMTFRKHPRLKSELEEVAVLAYENNSGEPITYLGEEKTFFFSLSNFPIFKHLRENQTFVIQNFQDYENFVRNRMIVPQKAKFANSGWRQAKLQSKEFVRYNIITHEMKVV